MELWLKNVYIYTFIYMYIYSIQLVKKLGQCNLGDCKSVGFPSSESSLFCHYNQRLG